MKRIFTILSMLLFPVFALAINEVTVSDDVTMVLPSDGSSYTLKAFSQYDSLNVSSTQFTFVLSQGGRATIISTDRKKFDTDAIAPVKVSTTCESSQSSITLDIDPPFTTTTINVTPSGTCSGGGGGVSGGSGISGGGGSSSGGGYTPTTVTTPVIVAPSKAPATTGVSQAPVFSVVLAPDSRGDDVKRLQEFLAKDKEVYPEGIVNGTFGPLTQKALIRFQLKHAIIKKSSDLGSGVLGPKTRAKLNELAQGTVSPVKNQDSEVPTVNVQGGSSAVFATVLSQGSRGDDVKRLQEFLAKDKEVYPEGIVNGTFGPLTKKAVINFQLKYGIIKTGSDLGSGRFGPATQAKVNELIGSGSGEKPQTQTNNQTEDAKIKALQDQLKALQDSLKLLKAQ